MTRTLSLVALVLWLVPVAALADPAQAQKALPPGVTPDWLESAKRGIDAAEYRFSASGEGAFSAPNRAKDLRTRVAGHGISVVSRTKGDAEFALELRLSRMGRGESLAAVPAGEARAAGERIEIHRESLPMVEWYTNDARGLEQGWTLSERPAGAKDESLVLELATDGVLNPVHRPQDGRIVFVDGTGAGRLFYGELVAFDSTGKGLDAVLTVADSRVQIRVTDSGATYPITIDPLIQPASWAVEPNVSSALFGASAATAGDVNGDGFSDVIVGSPGELSNRGKAYVYLGGPGGLATTAVSIVQGNAANDVFGASVAAGDVNGDGFGDVVIGAPQSTFGNAAGYIVVYLGSATGQLASPVTIAATQCFISFDADSHFGTSVAGAGDVDGDGFDDVVAGEPYLDIDASRQGSVCIYRGSATGVSAASKFLLLPHLSGTGAGPNDVIQSFAFGQSVAGAGDVNKDGFADVLVGAPSSHTVSGLATAVGAAYLFLGSASGPVTPAVWVQAGDDIADGADSTNGHFGYSVAGAGDLNGDGNPDVIVGAPNDDSSGANAGAVFVFHGSNSGIQVPAPDCDPGNFFTVVPAKYCEFGSAASASFGSMVSTAGDLNGDGYADALVGVPGLVNGLGGSGAVELIYGTGTGQYILAIPERIQTAETLTANFRLGNSIATAGDTDGDGFSEVIAGLGGHSNGQTNEGQALVFRGTGNPPPTNTLWAFTTVNSATIGSSIATLDANGDGRSDIAIGAPGFDSTFGDQGAVFVFQTPQSVNGSTPPTVGSASRTYSGLGAGAQFGYSVSNAGDINNDGFEELIVGSPGSSQAFMYLGSGGGLPLTFPSQNLNGTPGTRFGQSVTGAGDVTGDGLSDVVIGAPLDEVVGQPADEGVARLYVGTAGGTLASTSWFARSGQAGAQYGAVVSGVGDVNRDGYSDVLISAPFYYTDFGGFQLQIGLMQLFRGAAGGLQNVASWTVTGAGGISNRDVLGADLGYVGDVDADGFSDFWFRSDLIQGLNYTQRVVVYRGGTGTPTFLRVYNGQTAAGGDVNGDGLSDLVVGDSVAQTANLFAGPLSSTTSIWTVTGPANSSTGGELATGDVNGDGVSDVLVGAPFFDGGVADQGRVSLYLGNLPLYDDGQPMNGGQIELVGPGCTFCLLRNVALLGRLQSFPQQFFVSALARMPGGRGRARLQWESKSLGSNFNGTGVVQGGVQSLSTGNLISTDYIGVFGSVPQHWRFRLQTSNPHFPRSRWFTLAANGPNESDLRGAFDSDGDGLIDSADNCPGVPNPGQADGDLDRVGDACDNCLVTDNTDQLDGDIDGVGNACDSCTAHAKPGQVGCFASTNCGAWATTTGGQRDDDHDGYGNRCDGKFIGTGLVNSPDLTEFRASNNKNRTLDVCGTAGNRPCAIFDLDEVTLLNNNSDLTIMRTLINKLPGPKCPACPLACANGSAGSCSP